MNTTYIIMMNVLPCGPALPTIIGSPDQESDETNQNKNILDS